MAFSMEEQKYLEEKINGLSGKIDGVKDMVNDKFDELKDFYKNSIDAFRENTAIQLSHIKEQSDTFKDYHKKHFEEVEELKIKVAEVPQQITAARESIRKDLISKSRFNFGSVMAIISSIIAVVAVLVAVL